MADATNEVRDLWLYDDGSWREGFRDDGKVSPLLHFIARPAADDEAREERLKELRDWLAGANADLAYIDKAVVAAGYRFSTTEAQPEHVVEVAMFLASLKRDRDEWRARAERAEAALADGRCRWTAYSPRRPIPGPTGRRAPSMRGRAGHRPRGARQGSVRCRPGIPAPAPSVRCDARVRVGASWQVVRQ